MTRLTVLTAAPAYMSLTAARTARAERGTLGHSRSHRPLRTGPRPRPGRGAAGRAGRRRQHREDLLPFRPELPGIPGQQSPVGPLQVLLIAHVAIPPARSSRFSATAAWPQPGPHREPPGARGVSRQYRRAARPHRPVHPAAPARSRPGGQRPGARRARRRDRRGDHPRRPARARRRRARAPPARRPPRAPRPPPQARASRPLPCSSPAPARPRPTPARDPARETPQPPHPRAQRTDTEPLRTDGRSPDNGRSGLVGREGIRRRVMSKIDICSDWSGWRIRTRPPAPKAGALTKLRHIPLNRSVAYRLAGHGPTSSNGASHGGSCALLIRRAERPADHGGSAPRSCYGYAVGAHPMDRPPGTRA